MIAVSVGAAILMTVATGHAAEPCEPALAHIVSLQGQVEIQRGEAGAWTAAALDDQLCIGDGIRLGRLARAALALANDSVLRIDQLTTMRLAGEPESGRSLLDLLFGDVHFFSHRPRALEIVTPIASAGAEGTEFLMRVRPDRTEVVMFEGRVRLQTPEGELLLASGDAGVAVAGAAPRPEIIARPRDAVAWALYYPPILAPLAERRPAPSALPQGLQTAIERVAANDYAGAIAALDAVPEAARDARYYTYRAGVLLNAGRADQATQAIDRALALDPDAAEALAERAVIEAVQNRRADALADAKRAVELDPASAPARIALSYALQASFDLEAARATLREAAAQTPDNALVQARLAELELSFGNLDAAEAAAERAVALAPELERTQMVLGFAALTRIDIDQARAAFERAIALDSAEPLARLGLGLAKIRAGHLDAGGRELEIAVALDPNDSLLRSYLGKAYFEEKRGPQDADQFWIAKQLDPNDPTPWFYDAIRLQTENRPIEALHNLEKSIALNDNRAPYRSRLLLDEDVAVRQTSLARIYSDLGFNQVALVEATKSLNQDPTNYSAHRFLSDTYAFLPRHEIARASEQLQSQLFQPININPVPPSAPITDLNVITAARPTEAAFNEFTPLFERNRAQLTAAGTAGSNQTYGDELIASGLWNRYSISAGQFHFDTDGFRPNNSDNTNAYNLFGQVAISPQVNIQGEYRYRDTDEGDVEQFFNPDDFQPDLKRKLKQETGRLGIRYSPTPRFDLIASGFYSRRRDAFPSFDQSANDEGYQVEGQGIYRFDRSNLISGVGSYDIDADQHGATPAHLQRKQNNLYLYNNIQLPMNATLTLGMAYDSFKEDPIDETNLDPKLGLQWNVTDDILLRAAAFSTVKRALVVQQTIEPTEVAGFNQFLDYFNGTQTDTYAIGIDTRITKDIYGGLEFLQRNINEKFPVGDDVLNANEGEETANMYAYWALNDNWVLGAGYNYDHFERSDDVIIFGPAFPVRLDTHRVPLSIRYFNESGFFAGIIGTFVHQDMKTEVGLNAEQNPIKQVDDSDFFLLDVSIGYRLPKRVGMITIEGNNLLEQKFSFRDDNFRSSEARRAPIEPDRTVVARITLNF
jgi:tetratricopeptide (TPR) repeat protein